MTRNVHGRCSRCTLRLESSYFVMLGFVRTRKRVCSPQLLRIIIMGAAFSPFQNLKFGELKGFDTQLVEVNKSAANWERGNFPTEHVFCYATKIFCVCFTKKKQQISENMLKCVLFLQGIQSFGFFAKYCVNANTVYIYQLISVYFFRNTSPMGLFAVYYQT